jgi:hypothetical protein
MEHDLHLSPEELENSNRRKKLFKAPISYRVDDSLEFPDLSNSFEPKKVKMINKVKAKEIDLKKKKSKSNKLI